MWTVLLIVLAVLMLGGSWGYPRYGYAGFSPVGALALIAVLLYFTGHLRLR